MSPRTAKALHSSDSKNFKELQRRRTEPYTIRKADQEEFVRLLKLAGTFSVHIDYSHDDDLAEIFAQELATLLTAAQWEVKGAGAELVYVSGGKYPAGVTIAVPEQQGIPAGATLFMKLLREQGIWINYKETPMRKVDPASFDIFVGEKE
jgi:hypothetical protein